MDESRNADDRPERSPDDTTPVPGDAAKQQPAGGMGLGSCLLVIGCLVVLFMLVVPTTGSRPATRSEILETQRREELIEQALRDAQTADQAATEQADAAQQEVAAISGVDVTTADVNR
jgi:hypothetical protein